MRRLLVLALLLPAGCSGGGERPAALEQTSGPGRIVFVLNVGGDTDLYVLRPDGSARELLARTPELNEGATSWSPDGQLLAFDATPPEPGGWEASDVWVMRADGSGRRRLTENREPDVGPGWTADGRVVFTSCDLRRDEFPDCRLEAVRPDGSGRETLADGLGATFGTELSPDGSKLAYTPIGSEAEYLRPTIVVRELDGGEEHALARGTQPRWSPDGERLAFMSDRDRNGNCLFHDCEGSAPELYVMDADGDNQRRLTENPASEASPSWTPDGTKLVFSRIPDENDDHDLYVVNADGTCERQLTDTAEWELGPDWLGASGGPLKCADLAVTMTAPALMPAGRLLIARVFVRNAGNLRSAPSALKVEQPVGAHRRALPALEPGASWRTEVTLSAPAGVVRIAATAQAGDDPVAANDRAVVTVVSCTQLGTPGADRLVGTARADVLCGLGGDDRLDGRAGDDRLYGGPDADLLVGGPGRDRIERSAGCDEVRIDDGERDFAWAAATGRPWLVSDVGRDRVNIPGEC